MRTIDGPVVGAADVAAHAAWPRLVCSRNAQEYDPVSHVALFANIPLNMIFTNSAKLAIFLPARSASR